jgi:Fic family protein
MRELPYRFEEKKNPDGTTHTYIVKDVQVEGQKTKVYVQVDPSLTITESNANEIKEQYAHEIETKTIKKRAELYAERYKATYLPFDLVLQIEIIRALHQRVSELYTISELASYRRNFELHYVNGTTSIEGNTLTLEEVGQVLEHGIAPESKTLREINEVQNFKLMKKYRDGFKGKVTIKFIKRLHELIMNNIDFESAGTFRRTDDIRIAGSDIIPTPSLIIREEIENRIDEFYQGIEEKKHPFEQIILFHYQFEIIHPFSDGNGRVGREVLNYLLDHYHYPKFFFPGKYRERYIKALISGNNEQYQDMVESIASLLFDQYSDALQSNLKSVVIPVREKEQKRLADYFSV